jgi:hypothetical protein
MPDLPKYLAFDLETAELPQWGHQRTRRRPVGITCAATLASDEPHCRLWHGVNAEDRPADRMQADDARQLVDFLVQRTAEGYAVLTWNGLDFDFQVLAEESHAREECQQLAWNHVDMMFHVFCVQGFRVGLDKAAQGSGVPGKPKGMSGILAPAMWAEGRRQEVLDYVSQDVRATLQLALTGQQRRSMGWITSNGRLRRMPLPNGWLPVHKALRLPEPDTSWMDAPSPRSEFVAWLGSRAST